eukprot:TRINITY_DN47945_c0_g1_i1.p1 TRINITY_DN47945_c0_g1~~TRINITY_DN47945_c0_g1_i1.p1  ORF type:complete len:676 (-),score=42.28 TRINITY_DN47945_c0_g1_i1:140-2167(-)
MVDVRFAVIIALLLAHALNSFQSVRVSEAGDDPVDESLREESMSEDTFEETSFDMLSGGSAIGFGGGGYGALVAAQGMLTGLDLIRCEGAHDEKCVLTADAFSMILGVSGGSWGLGLYFSGARQPQKKSSVNDFSLRRALQHSDLCDGDPVETWTNFIFEEMLSPAGIQANQSLPKEHGSVNYVAAAFFSEDAERPDLITYTAEGFCFVHAKKCYKWTGSSMTLREVLFRSSNILGCLPDMMRLPPWKMWRKSVRKGRVVRPVWYLPSLRDSISSLTTVGVTGKYQPTTSESQFRGVTVSDGGVLDNSGIMPAFARGLDRLFIVTLLVTSFPAYSIMKTKKKGWLENIDLSEEMLQLFGVVPDASIKGAWISLNQVFHIAALRPAVRALAASVHSGLGGVSTVRLRTIKNEYWGIEEDRLVTITFVVPHFASSCKDHARCIARKIKATSKGTCSSDKMGAESTQAAIEKASHEVHSHIPDVSAEQIAADTEAAESVQGTDDREASEGTNVRTVSELSGRKLMRAAAKFMSRPDILGANIELAAMVGFTSKKTKLPQLPLLMPRMDGPFKKEALKCTKLVFDYMQALVDENRYHFTNDPFHVNVKAEVESANMSSTFADLNDLKCTPPPETLCRTNRRCKTLFGSHSRCSSKILAGNCVCSEFHCFSLKDSVCSKW